MKQISASHLRIDCDNCLDHQGVIVVAYDDGEARLFPIGDSTAAVAMRRVVKAHDRRGYSCITPVNSLDTVVNFVEIKCPTCQWEEDAVVVVDPGTLDHVVAA